MIEWLNNVDTPSILVQGGGGGRGKLKYVLTCTNTEARRKKCWQNIQKCLGWGEGRGDDPKFGGADLNGGLLLEGGGGVPHMSSPWYICLLVCNVYSWYMKDDLSTQVGRYNSKQTETGREEYFSVNHVHWINSGYILDPIQNLIAKLSPSFSPSRLSGFISSYVNHPQPTQ